MGRKVLISRDIIFDESTNVHSLTTHKPSEQLVSYPDDLVICHILPQISSNPERIPDSSQTPSSAPSPTPPPPIPELESPPLFSSPPPQAEPPPSQYSGCIHIPPQPWWFVPNATQYRNLLPALAKIPQYYKLL